MLVKRSNYQLLLAGRVSYCKFKHSAVAGERCKLLLGEEISFCWLKGSAVVG